MKYLHHITITAILLFKAVHPMQRPPQYINFEQSLTRKANILPSNDHQALTYVENHITKRTPPHILQTYLEKAIINNNPKTTAHLLTYGTPPPKKMLFHEVTKANHENISTLKAFVPYLDNIDVRDRIKRTPLHYAATTNNTEAISMLLSHGADPNAEDDCGRPPLGWAARYGKTDAIYTLLLCKHTDINKTTKLGTSPLSWALSSGNKKAMNMLINHGAQIYTRDNKDKTGLDWAKHCLPWKKFILISESFYHRVYQLKHLLHQAAQHGNDTTVKNLLSQGISPNIPDRTQNRPLHWATMHGHIDIIKILLQADADPNAHNDKKRTSLNSAAYTGHSEVIPHLLQAGADHSPDIYDNTPFENAIIYRNFSTARNLLFQCVQTQDKHRLVHKLANIISKQKVDTDRCAIKQITNLASLLILFGANTQAHDENGMCPADKVRQSELQELTKILEQPKAYRLF